MTGSQDVRAQDWGRFRIPGQEQGILVQNTWLVCERRTHLLQEDGVVAFKGLEDVVVAPPGPEAIAGCIAVATTAFPAGGYAAGGEASGVGFQPWAHTV